VDQPLVRVVALCRAYRLGGNTVEALRGVTLDIARGEFLAVMGPSGSGKSTLLTLLGLLTRPTGGRYELDGRDVAHLDDDERSLLRRRNIGLVFQTFNRLARSTAVENVELPLFYEGLGYRERRRRAAAALSEVGLAERRDHWPQQLSGGEQQRVAIARALVNDPLLILADEPTGALDSATRLQIMGLFQALNAAGRTIVLVTHDPEIARFAARTVWIRDGKVERDENVTQRLGATSLSEYRKGRHP
jgi:putative ABC transport system ATP-binding protein